MKHLRSHALSITTLSPVHVGGNETYDPTCYVIEDDALFEFNTEEAMRALAEPERKKLLGLVNGPANDQMLKNVQSFFYSNRYPLLAMSTHSLPVGRGVAGLYQARIGKAAQREDHGKQVINKLEIERTAYNPQDRKPIIPGSGIKGAVRTALLNEVNKGRRSERRERNRELQQRLFQYSSRDLHLDPMRLVSVSDARWSADPALPGSEIRFAVNRKKHPVEKNGRLLQSQAEQKGLYQLLECMPPLRFRTLVTEIRIQKVQTISDHGARLPAKEFQWGIQEIARACNGFYRPLFDAEIKLLEERGYMDPQWAQTVRAIVPEVDSTDRFLLRLGRHCGAEALTLNGLRSIKIMGAFKARPTYEPAAKTLWLAASDTGMKTGMVPFGWVLVEIDPVNNAVLRRQLEGALAPAIEWRSKHSALQQQHRERLDAEREQQRREALQQEEERRAEELQQAEQAKRLAAMSPLQKDIHEILETQHDPAMVLFHELERGRWDNPPDQAQVAKTIRDLWRRAGIWIPDFPGTNKSKVKRRDRCLKVREYLRD